MFENFLIWEGDMEAAGVAPCGMFSPTHLAVTAVCLIALIAGVYFSRGLSEKRLNRIVLYIAIPVTALECGKIVFNWVHGGITPNHWLPLTFCSFSIYSYWMIALGNRFVREMGKGFICGGGIIGGFTFLLMPMTSVATYPMAHFLSCYSMLFHSLMMYVGLSYLVNGYFSFSRDGYKKYLWFCVPACLLALAVNLVYAAFDDIANCNMMFLSDPYRLSSILPFIGDVYAAAPAVYTLCVLAVYLTVPYFLPYGVLRLIGLFRVRRKEPESVKEAV